MAKINMKHKAKKDPQKKHMLGTVSTKITVGFAMGCDSGATVSVSLFVDPAHSLFTCFCVCGEVLTFAIISEKECRSLKTICNLVVMWALLLYDL